MNMNARTLALMGAMIIGTTHLACAIDARPLDISAAYPGQQI